MMLFLMFIGLTIFIFGLIQWARGGATLWQIFRIRRRESSLSAEERQQAEGEVRRLERMTDRALSASFRILGFLAICTWLLIGVTLLLDLLGIDWMTNLSARARAYWNAASLSESYGSRNLPNRNDVLRNMGSNLRK